MNTGTKDIVIVGAGMGGLAAAARLAAAGAHVRVFEAASEPGGKMRALPSAAGPIDAGPTVVTMRWVFESLFTDCGARLSDHVDFHAAPVLARHYWPDGASLDLFADVEDSARAIEAFAGRREAEAFRAFDRDATRLFEAFRTPVMETPRPSPPGVARAVAPGALQLLPIMARARTLFGALSTRFRDPRLAQLFARYATYVGGSPFLSPALLMLVWRAEGAGVWHIGGGVARLAQAIRDIAQERGARFHFDTLVDAVLTEDGRASGVRLASGEAVRADAVLFNGDPGALSSGMLGEAVRTAVPALPRRKRSLSAHVWAFAGSPRGVPLSHHTVFFPDEPRSEFEDIFRHRRAPENPVVYVCAQDRGGGAAPPETERLMMIVNAPAEGDRPGPDRDREVASCRQRTWNRLSQAGLLLDPPEGTALTTPADFSARFPGAGGALYGMAPHGAMATFRRPTARSRLKGLYLAGGGTHPGAGVPMAATSGLFAAQAISSDLSLISTSPATVMPGGISMRSARTEGAA